MFAAEPDLLRHLPAGHAELARRTTVVDCVVLPPGPLSPPSIRADIVDLGFLILDGHITRRVDVLGQTAVELLGPGDLIRPWRGDAAEDFSLPHETRWSVCSTTRLAILDRRFERDVARWPGVLAELLDRLSTRAGGLTLQLAIVRLPRLDTRLLYLFWRLADRWGRVEPGGVSVTVRLTQETLAELVAAQRASVNAALRSLRERDLLVQESRGRWVLRGEPPARSRDRDAYFSRPAASAA